MKTKRILCPVDFSACSDRALEDASAEAARTGAKLYIVHVDNQGHAYPPDNPAYVPELDAHRRLLDEAMPTVGGVRFEHHYLRGNAIDEIRRFAALRDIDLIVLGTHGRSALSRALMGSVAESLTSKSPCQVVTVPVEQPKTTQNT